MVEVAAQIFEHLPIRRNVQENDYIDHLWSAFTVLDGSDGIGRPFAVMPFHLLFMLSIQYKVLRIYKEQKEKYELALVTKNPRDEERDVLAPESPLTIGFLGESEIVDLLKVSGLSTEDARNMKKSVVRYRNDKIAHAKGYMEPDLEGKVTEYLDSLNVLDGAYRAMNVKIAKAWLAEVKEEDDFGEFFESRFLDACLTPFDFGDVLSVFLNADQFDLLQFQQIVEKGLELSYSQTITTLKECLKPELDQRKKEFVKKTLIENGELD